MSETVCRTCLTANTKMLDLRNTRLQKTFEKLISKKLSADNEWSRICNICYLQLQRCSRFLAMAREADQMLKQILKKGIAIELIPECITALRPRNGLSMTPMNYMSLPDYSLPLNMLVTVKTEPVEVKVKVEEPDDSLLVKAIKIDDLPLADKLKSVCDQEIVPCKRHVTKSHKKLAYTCKKCNKDFARLNTLIVHIDTHRKVNLSCDVCDKRFTNKRVFQNHLRKHTKPFGCQLCDKSFSERSSLNKHVTSHSAEKPYICDCCDKSFAHRTFLITHLRGHMGEKPYSCELCSKKFAQSGHKISHLRSHYKLKPFPCRVCGKPFAERSTVKKHMRTHSPVNPYTCEICYKIFRYPGAVTRHMRAHERREEKIKKLKAENICMECGKRFATRRNMQKHMKSQHEVKPHMKIAQS